MEFVLDLPSAPVERLPSQTNHAEGIDHRSGVRQVLIRGGLEAGEPVHRDDLDAVAPVLLTVAQPCLKRLLGAAFGHAWQPGGVGAIPEQTG